MNSLIYSILYNALNFLPGTGKYIRWRGKITEKVIAKTGGNLKLSSRVNIYNPANLSVGRNVYIGYCTYIGGGKVELEDEVVIGPFCTIVAGNHTMKDDSYRFGPYNYGSILIGRGSWLGANVVITSNVTLGKGVLVAAGSVVTRDVPDFAIVGGVPAKILKEGKESAI